MWLFTRPGTTPLNLLSWSIELISYDLFPFLQESQEPSLTYFGWVYVFIYIYNDIYIYVCVCVLGRAISSYGSQHIVDGR